MDCSPDNPGSRQSIDILFTRPRVHEVEPPDVGRDSGFLSIVAEDTDAATLGELVVLIVEVLRRHQVVDQRPFLSSAQQGGREDDAEIKLGLSLNQTFKKC